MNTLVAWVATEAVLKNTIAHANSDTARTYRVELVMDVDMSGPWPSQSSALFIAANVKIAIVGAKPGGESRWVVFVRLEIRRSC